MEVHKHPHHVTHKKKWIEYLLEFLMLFLAVFLGFVAENIREHLVERTKEKEYVQSLREDMTQDTAILQSGINLMQKYSSAGDSLVMMIVQGRTKTEEEIKKLYEYNLPALGGFYISLTDRTEAQLKNSGGMRLITNKKVSDAIVDYWNGVEGLKVLFQDIHDLRMKAREKSYTIFDNKFYSQQEVNGERPVLDHPRLMTDEYTSIAEFGNRVSHVKNLTQFYIVTLNKQKARADSLINKIDKEY